MSRITQRAEWGQGMHMYDYGKITAVRLNDKGADLLVHVSDDVAAVVNRKKISDIWMRLDDGREISALQRKKIYATLKDISVYTGYLPEECKEIMKYWHIERTGSEYFSLSDCSMDVAREFINSLIAFCLSYGVITADSLLERTDDIATYLVQCLQYRKCCVCGKKGEVHHWDAIGMGNDRRVCDDSQKRKVCLCRLHHTIAHQKGREAFQRDYHVYGIIYNEEETDGL